MNNNFMPETGLEPVQSKRPRDFKSLASASSATPAYEDECITIHKKITDFHKKYS